MAGKRLGKEDTRHLWPEMLRAIREVRPRYIVGENVRGLLSWNGGLVFNEVQSDLEAEGYEVLPFLLPACGVNAPHKRERIWFIAYAVSAGTRSVSREIGDKRRGTGQDRAEGIRQGHGAISTGRFDTTSSNVTDTSSAGLSPGRQTGFREYETKAAERMDYRPEQFCATSNTCFGNGRMLCRQESGGEKQQKHSNPRLRMGWQDFPTQPPVCSRDDGISSELVGITFSKHRNESIKAYGNAIVPQVVYPIFKVIAHMDWINS